MLVRQAGRPARCVVLAGCTDLPGERHARGREPDLAVLVLDVELECGEAVPLERDVLLELPGKRGEPERHVDAAQLERKRAPVGCERRGRRVHGRGRRLAARPADELRTSCEEHDAQK